MFFKSKRIKELEGRIRDLERIVFDIGYMDIYSDLNLKHPCSTPRIKVKKALRLLLKRYDLEIKHLSARPDIFELKRKIE